MGGGGGFGEGNKNKLCIKFLWIIKPFQERRPPFAAKDKGQTPSLINRHE